MQGTLWDIMGLSFDGSMIHMDVGFLTATRVIFLGKPFSARNFVKSFQLESGTPLCHSTFQELFIHTIHDVS